MPTIAITGSSGNLGNATLSALLSRNLAPASCIVALTSSQPGSATWAELRAQSGEMQIRHASFEDPASFESALRGVDKFFLVSTPRVELDFEDDDGSEVPDGGGREAHHKVAIDAAAASGVRYVYYSSLAYAWDARPGRRSKAAVMRAHLRTEAYLAAEGRFQGVVRIREGLYAESWPLYLGSFDAAGRDGRTVVPLAADGRACWTAIPDLGLANALVLAADGAEYAGRTFYLSVRPEMARTVSEVAGLVGEARGREVRVEIVGMEGHERHYVGELGRDKKYVRWWAGSYEALGEGECLVDDGTLERLLAGVGVRPTGVEEIIRQMVGEEGMRR
ncbi:NAD(P)-binding protein [Jackrogersella minutella]|nr:NAD(P)-binding protein [Jackrogersella minutella]